MIRKAPNILPRDLGIARYMPWILAIMVFLAVMAATGGLVLFRAVDAWSTDLGSALTVEVAGLGEARQASGEALLTALGSSPVVRETRLIAPEEVAGLLQPWLGKGGLVDELPLPLLIDVRLTEPGAEAVGQLVQLVESVAPGSSVDDHALWLGQLNRISRSVQLLALGIVLMVGAATVLAVLFGTQAAMAAHRDIIELVHLMGAQDSMIAGRFQWLAVAMSVRGGLVGLALAVLSLFALSLALGPGLQMVFEGPMFEGSDLLLVSLLPFAAGLVAAVTARITVQRALRRIY